MYSEQGEWEKNLKNPPERQGGAERKSKMAELIWPWAISGYSSHFLSTFFLPVIQPNLPSASVSLKSSLRLHLSWQDWLLLKLLYFNNCDHWLMITDWLTLVLFSQSVCTSFWDRPRSQYSLSQKENKYIMIELCGGGHHHDGFHTNTFC